jgi:S1-C subfamily serine protease
VVSEQILANGHVERGYVGMALRPVATGGPGAEVVAVEKDSPAALAGLVPGDVVRSFDGDEVPDPAALVLMLTRSSVGTEASLEVERGGTTRTVPIRIGRRPRDL